VGAQGLISRIAQLLRAIARSVEGFGELPAASVHQALCTDYDVGVGIGWHREKRRFDKVLGLALGAACKFRFRRIGEKMRAPYTSSGST
jgi:alkylated DNA repair dioxygenase AlkB